MKRHQLLKGLAWTAAIRRSQGPPWILWLTAQRRNRSFLQLNQLRRRNRTSGSHTILLSKSSRPILHKHRSQSRDRPLGMPLQSQTIQHLQTMRMLKRWWIWLPPFKSSITSPCASWRKLRQKPSNRSTPTTRSMICLSWAKEVRRLGNLTTWWPIFRWTVAVPPLENLTNQMQWLMHKLSLQQRIITQIGSRSQVPPKYQSRVKCTKASRVLIIRVRQQRAHHRFTCLSIHKRQQLPLNQPWWLNQMRTKKETGCSTQSIYTYVVWPSAENKWKSYKRR